MDSVEHKLLVQMLHRLGLGDNQQLLQKSTELLRLLQIKASGGTTNLGDYAKATICVDLASSQLGLPIDSDAALKLSGMRRTVYVNSKRTVEKLLDINKVLGVGEICVQLGVSQLQKEATILLDAYRNYCSSTCSEGGEVGGQLDFGHPQYATMAIYQAAKRMKVKVPKGKLLPLSHLKPAQWNLLEKNWDRFLASGVVTKGAIKSAQEESSMEADLRAEQNGGSSSPEKARKHSSPEKIEPYVNWKKRMLEKAYRELKAIQKRG